MELTDNIEDKIYRDAVYYAEQAQLANKNKLLNIFKMIDSAACNGQYTVTLGSDIILNDDQCELLDDLGFDVQETCDDNNDDIFVINFEQ